MIPIGDSTRSRTTPYVNVAIIAAAVGVFIYELTLSTVDVNRFFLDWGVIPKQLIDWLESPSGAEEPATVFASMFMQGGWLPLVGDTRFLLGVGDRGGAGRLPGAVPARHSGRAHPLVVVLRGVPGAGRLPHRLLVSAPTAQRRGLARHRHRRGGRGRRVGARRGGGGRGRGGLGGVGELAGPRPPL